MGCRQLSLERQHCKVLMMVVNCVVGEVVQVISLLDYHSVVVSFHIQLSVVVQNH